MIDAIRRKIEADQFEFSKHATDQSIIRRISVQEVRELFSKAEVIEDYPEDKYGPGCLQTGIFCIGATRVSVGGGRIDRA